jgi:hypothetical protein
MHPQFYIYQKEKREKTYNDDFTNKIKNASIGMSEALIK